MKLKRIIASTLLATGVLSFGPQAGAEDLWDIYQLAVQNDAEFLAARANYEAARIDLPLARSQFKPTVTSSGTLGKQRSDVSGSTTTSDNNQLNLSVDLPIYNRSDSIGIDQAALQVENARLQYEIAQDDLTLRVAERYFNLLAARDEREVALLQKVAIKRQMDLASERLDVGLGTRTDLFDARARFQQADADLIASEIQINNARQALIEIIALQPETISTLEENSPLDSPEPNDIDYWTSLATSNNLQVLSQQMNLLVASHEVDKQRAARSPTLSVGAAQRWNDGSSTSSFSSDDSNTTSVGLTLDVPIYLGGSINLRTRQAGMRFNASEQVLLSARRLAESQTTTAFLSVTSGISQVLALEEAIRAGESALEAKEEGFGAGLTTNLDVLDAQRDLSRSRVDYLRARYNYIISLLQLEQATGNLGDEDIQFINEWLKDDNTAYRQNTLGADLQLASIDNPTMMSFTTELQ